MISKYPQTETGTAPAQITPITPRSRMFLWIFSVILIVTAGTAFIFKLIEFYYTATNEGSAALTSFLIPVLNYLMVAAGFFCLFFWAYCSGQFRNVEDVKYRMLEMQDEIDAAEAEEKRHEGTEARRHEGSET